MFEDIAEPWETHPLPPVHQTAATGSAVSQAERFLWSLIIGTLISPGPDREPMTVPTQEDVIIAYAVEMITVFFESDERRKRLFWKFI